MSFYLPLAFLLSCEAKLPEPPITIDAATTEAREDSLALAAAYAGQALIQREVTAKVETASAHATKLEDAADDPAIWRHPTDPAQSLIFGSNKTGGLAAYNLKGAEVAYYPIGKINNVDILPGVLLSGESITVLGCSNRTNQSVDLFRIHPESGVLSSIAAGGLPMDSAKIDDVYGFCFGQVGEEVYAIVNGKNGRMQQFLLVEKEGEFELKLVREIKFDSQTEGMVADAELGWLYVGEEGKGVWKLPLDPSRDVAGVQVQSLVKASDVANNTAIVADVEGITLAREPNGEGSLVVSIQGNFSYAVFDRKGDNAYRGSFKISEGKFADGAEETDGLEVMDTNFGPEFPRGLLVVQDGFNFQGDSLVPQNFKFVDWGTVLDALD